MKTKNKLRAICASLVVAFVATFGAVGIAAPAQAATNVRVCNAGSSLTYLNYKLYPNTSTVYRMWPGQCLTGNFFSASTPSSYYTLWVNGAWKTNIVAMTTPNRVYSIHVIRL